MTMHAATQMAMNTATDTGGLVTGYASLFGRPDLGRDVVAPGAFAQSLGARGAAGVRMLFQHDPAEPVGVWLDIREDARGLRVAGRLNLAVQRARELDALIRQGALDGLSIGFRTRSAAPDRAGYRHLRAVDLWEISLVTFPLQPGARLDAALGLRMRDLARRIAPASLTGDRA